MPHYPYFHHPGIDKLGRIINEGPGTVLTVKQLDSAVCQLGKQRALCENYGCSGQDFAHTGRKWIGDWAYVLGITLNNPHLSLYSMRGERKRDYPQSSLLPAALVEGQPPDRRLLRPPQLRAQPGPACGGHPGHPSHGQRLGSLHARRHRPSTSSTGPLNAC